MQKEAAHPNGHIVADYVETSFGPFDSTWSDFFDAHRLVNDILSLNWDGSHQINARTAHKVHDKSRDCAAYLVEQPPFIVEIVMINI